MWIFGEVIGKTSLPQRDISPLDRKHKTAHISIETFQVTDTLVNNTEKTSHSLSLYFKTPTESVFLCFVAADGRGVQRRRLLGTGIPLAQEESLLRFCLRHFPRRRSFDVVYFRRTGSYSAKSSTCTVSVNSLRLKNCDLHELTSIFLNQFQISWIRLQHNRFFSLIAHKVKFVLLYFFKHTMDFI